MINRKPTKFRAISELVGGGISGADDGTLMEYRGKTPPTEAEINAKYDELIKAWNDSEYQRNRKPEYPKIGDQLDMLFHAIDAGKVDKTSDFYKSLKAVKDKYPKG